MLEFGLLVCILRTLEPDLGSDVLMGMRREELEAGLYIALGKMPRDPIATTDELSADGLGS